MMWVPIYLHHRSLQNQKDLTPHITTTSTRKTRQDIVVGGSLLRGTESPICWADPPHREVCCIPGAQVRGITRKLPRLLWPSDYYPLLLYHVGTKLQYIAQV